MSFKYIILIAIYLLLTVSGIVIFKLGANQNLEFKSVSGNLAFSFNYKVILGLLAYICSFLLYMFLVSKFDLSYIVPIATGIVYILTLLSSVYIFKDKLNTYNIIGVILVLIGVVLVNIKNIK